MRSAWTFNLCDCPQKSSLVFSL